LVSIHSLEKYQDVDFGKLDPKLDQWKQGEASTA